MENEYLTIIERFATGGTDIGTTLNMMERLFRLNRRFFIDNVRLGFVIRKIQTTTLYINIFPFSSKNLLIEQIIDIFPRCVEHNYTHQFDTCCSILRRNCIKYKSPKALILRPHFLWNEKRWLSQNSMIDILADDFNIVDPITLCDGQLLSQTFRTIENKINIDSYNSYHETKIDINEYVSYREAFFLFYHNPNITKELFKRVFDTKNCNYSAICDIVKLKTKYDDETIETFTLDQLWDYYRNVS